jgi:6-phosphogluconolactonase
VAVENCPKPPPTRVSLTLPSIQAAREVWVITAGEEKADAVAASLAGANPVKVPAAGARGTERTLWLLDRAAASRLSAKTHDGRGRPTTDVLELSPIDNTS